MKNLQVKGVPDSLHERLRECANRRGTTMRDVVLEAINRELGHEDFVARLARRSSVDLGVPASRLLAEERADRD